MSLPDRSNSPAASRASFTEYRIPFNKAAITENTLNYLTMSINSGQICGDGQFTKKCSALLESELGVKRVLLTCSGTHALEMAALLLDIKADDEVIIPSFTFVSTVNAFVLRGARPVFIDIREDTLNLDESLLSGLINERTRAVVPVHYGGVACNMQAIMDICRKDRIAVVEDNAHGLFGKYSDRFLGTFGEMAALSFHETKNFQCGEGGAIIINDPDYIDRAEIIRQKGTDRTRFLAGQVDKYSWVDIGSSYLPSDILAAVLLSQLEAREHIQSRRSQIWNSYRDGLGDWAERKGFRLPIVPPECDQNFHLFYILLSGESERQRLIDHLKERGILAVHHYLPLNDSLMGRRFGYRGDECPVTSSISERLLRLPFFPDLSESQQSEVIEALLEF